MNYNFTQFKKEVENVSHWLTKELSAVRTGMASLSILDNVKVESYGVLTPINQVANISKEDAKTIRIAPWDLSQIKTIESALREADLGVSVAVDDKGVRLSFPDLTGERRQDFVKVVKNKLEQAKISLRGERDKVWNDLQEKEKKGEISQDEKFRLKEEMQKIVDTANQKLAELSENKEKEILS